MKNPIDDFVVEKNDIQFIGNDLSRPECILATSDGCLWTSDLRGGITKIFPNGKQELIINKKMPSISSVPNGLCFTKDKKILIANIGNNCLEMLDLQGNNTTLIETIDGKPIGKVNFVLRDSKNRLYITISTRKEQWIDAINPNVKDGYIVLLDNIGARIVADGFAFTNEIRFDAKEEYIYISETCGRCIKRMRVDEDGSLSNCEVYGPSDLGLAGFPDGIAFDSYGNLWGSLSLGEKIFAIKPNGDLKIIFNDCNDEVAKKIDAAFYNSCLTEKLMFSGLSAIAPNMTSVTFGSKTLDHLFIGSMFGKSIPYFKVPVKGNPPIWWKE